MSAVVKDGYLRLILDTIDQGIFTIDEDWNITTFNRAAERISGYTSAEAIGRRCYEVFRAEPCEGDCPLRRAMGLGQVVRGMRTTITRRDGTRVSIELNASALVGPSGELVGGVESFQDLTPMDDLRKQLEGRYRFDDIVAKSPPMQDLVRLLGPIADSDSQVLITGPSGSGKELVARAIHNHSHRRAGPFVAVNCAALPDTLLESELFGYRRGAFTGAVRDKPGRIDQAQGGTLFLDEVGDLAPALQVKMLRFLQHREFEPLGDTATRRADVRVLAATNRVLECMVAEGSFREDLYYRLNVVQVTLPQLASRREDIPILVQAFLDRFRASTGKNIRAVTPSAMAALCSYDYPGNVRELENAIERAFIFTAGQAIDVDALPRNLVDGNGEGLHPSRAPGTKGSPASPVPGSPPPDRGALDRAEMQTIARVLERHGGNRSAAARELGIHRSTLLRKLRQG